ncbi:MAG TPA: ABC transporter permease [Streptosporangiaceae bacterium]|jgi:lipooligosaccharide transport system permease protein|nr:ABC transporter permease [Streptosporangiaceae bacterium]
MSDRHDAGVQALPLRVVPWPALSRLRGVLGGRSSLHLIERNARAYRHAWLVLLSGVGEPLFYLLSIGVGLGKLVGTVAGPGGQPVSYTAFVAPALLATSAMNGAIYDSTFNVFFLLKYAKLYDAVLATPMRATDVALGQIGWALIRGALYALAFVLVMLGMGLLRSGWAVLALPAAILTGFAFAATGMAASTFMRSWQDFEYVTLVSLPLFLFSTTFYPLSVYPRAVQIVVECTPLYQAVTLLRGLTLGGAGLGLLVPVGYLAVMGMTGLVIAGRRVGSLLLT